METASLTVTCGNPASSPPGGGIDPTSLFRHLRLSVVGPANPCSFGGLLQGRRNT